MAITQKDFEDLLRDALRWRAVAKIARPEVVDQYHHPVASADGKSFERKLVRVKEVRLRYRGEVSFAESIDVTVEQLKKEGEL